MHPDLIATRQAIRQGLKTSVQVAEECLALAQSAACDSVFLQLTPDNLRATAAQAGIHNSPLAGLPVSVKDLFDVQGQVTAAGSMALAQAPVARKDSPAVARLRQAGAGLIGRTNMVEFAFPASATTPTMAHPKPGMR